MGAVVLQRALTRVRFRVEVLAQRDRGSDDASKVEYGPENSDVAAFLAFDRVRQHKRALGGP